MRQLDWLWRKAATIVARHRRLRRVGEGDALYRLEPEDYAVTARRVSIMAVIRGHARVVRLDDGSMLCRALGRYIMAVDGTDRGLSAMLMMEGYWEYQVVSFIARQLRPGQVAIDVGANLGLFTVLMADIVGEAGRVEAIEANAALARLAERNTALNNVSTRARVHVAAAAERSGETRRLRFDIADSKNGHILPPGVTYGADPIGTMHEVSVTTLALDDLVAGAVDFVKVDVEGAEEAVWGGMQRLLDRSPDVIVLMEFNRERCADPAGLLQDMARRFPLRELRLDTRIVPVTIASLLDRVGDAQLVLTRQTLGKGL